MTFVSALRDFHTCRFAECTFRVEASTLHQFAGLYPLPDSLHRAVLKRQVEFLAGRVCAQHAIEALSGHKPYPIPSRSDRAPAWPCGIVGSITHTSQYAAALVAAETQYQGIGIDCESVLSPEQLKLQKHICVTNELEALCVSHSMWSPEMLLTLVFSAKESLFKCLYPQVQTYFGFSAARVMALDIEQHTFVIRLEQDLPSELRRHSEWAGYVWRQDNLLMTVILYPTQLR